MRNQAPWLAAALMIVAAVAVFGGLGLSRLTKPVEGIGPSSAEPPVTVHLFVPPEEVDHGSRFHFSFDPPEVLVPLRMGEGLDGVVAGSATYEEAWRRLMDWTAEQWEQGVPDPYPPPDATVVLRDIRSGFTGGFCAQYCVVLVQAIQSMGAPARYVTIEGHEVVEAWLADEQRWVTFDPTYRLQIFDSTGRSLNALEIRRLVEEGASGTMELSAGHRLPEAVEQYLDRYRDFAVWIRNDLVSRPMNFSDFDRYRVWLAPNELLQTPSASLITTVEEDLYPGIGPLEP